MFSRRLSLPALILAAGLVGVWIFSRPVGASSHELRAPAGNRATNIDPGGETIIPNGRIITPLGRQVRVAPHPYGLALSPDGQTIVTANNGCRPFSISIIKDLDTATPVVAQIPPGATNDDADLKSVYLGIAVAPDNRTVYVSEGDNGRVGVFDMVSRRRVAEVNLDGIFQGKTYQHSLTAELKLSSNGEKVYVVDMAHFRLVVIDGKSLKISASLTVGRLPFGMAVSPQSGLVYVSNVGVFRYQLIPGLDPKNMKATGLATAPFAFPSKEARDGTVVDGHRVPGLGNPNTLDSNTVWVIDASKPATPRVTAKIPTGIPLGEKSFGGASPGALVAGRERVYVSNTNQDSIAILDAASGRVLQTVKLEPAESVRGLGGVLPFGLALSPDEKRLYIACAGINAVAVMDTVARTVLGYLPMGWFPSRVALNHDGTTLYVSNGKGFGSGPNAGPNFHSGLEGTYIGDISSGVISIVPVPADADLPELTSRVLRNNGFVPVAVEPRPEGFPIPSAGQASTKIHHVVFIVKENRTYDEVFGDIASSHGDAANGVADLAKFGENSTVSEKGGPTLKNVAVTPNHHALARQFALSDNFYVDSDVSTDGHHWLQGSYPNEFTETTWPANYGDKFNFAADNDAPGRLMVGGAMPRPEEYEQGGMLWTHLHRHHISFRNWGQGYDLAGDSDDISYVPSGMRLSTNAPTPKVLFDNTSRTYPAFNTAIPDQYRFEQFKREFEERYVRGHETLPQFLYIWLPNDHTDDPHPKTGYPYRASYVADNDLALGKIMELFSHSPFWKDMAIFVTEDDAQDGLDHVDAHRSVLLVVSPHARRGISHVHSSMVSILKTFDLILGIPPLNQFDAAASDLSDMFTSQPDFTPYQALPSDRRIFDPVKTVMPASGKLPHSAPLDDPNVIRRNMRQPPRDQK
jgi:DNA-binding beta-propeller fold protein YncE